MELKKDKKGQVIDKPYFRNMFKEEMGNPDKIKKIDDELLNKYKDILPEELMMYWKDYGLTSFKDGLFWLTNPDEYTEIVEQYLATTPLGNKKDIYVVARSAFGNLLIWEKSKGNIIDIKLSTNTIFLNATKNRQDLSLEEEEYEMNRFIGNKFPRYFDIKDESRKPLFERALKKLGKLESNQMYGFKLLPDLGGKKSIRNLDIVDLFIYADIQIGIEKPSFSIIDTENMTYSY